MKPERIMIMVGVGFMELTTDIKVSLRLQSAAYYRRDPRTLFPSCGPIDLHPLVAEKHLERVIYVEYRLPIQRSITIVKCNATMFISETPPIRA
jgi:hypothetical protein